MSAVLTCIGLDPFGGRRAISGLLLHLATESAERGTTNPKCQVGRLDGELTSECNSHATSPEEVVQLLRLVQSTKLWRVRPRCKISRWALAGVSPRFPSEPTRSVRRLM